MGEGEGRHRRQRQRDRDGEQRDQQRIAERAPIAEARQDLPVIVPYPLTRQAEQIDAQLAERLEAAEDGGEDRHDHDRGDDRQRVEDRDGRQRVHATARRRMRLDGRGDRVGRLSHCA